jgi:hypothetical protein
VLRLPCKQNEALFTTCNDGRTAHGVRLMPHRRRMIFEAAGIVVKLPGFRVFLQVCTPQNYTKVVVQ